MASNDPIPVNINLQQKSRLLNLEYENGDRYSLSCEYLRVYSPSADVRGHGPGQATLQTGKEKVAIAAIEPVGNYAIKFQFDDGHNTGIYTWPYLYDLCINHDKYWREYLDALQSAGHARKIDG